MDAEPVPLVLAVRASMYLADLDWAAWVRILYRAAEKCRDASVTVDIGEPN